MIKKILVVDDEHLIRSFLNDSLIRLKKEVHWLPMLKKQ